MTLPSLNRIFIFETALFLVLLSLLTAAFRLVEPSYIQGIYRIEQSDDWQEYRHPFEMDTPENVTPELYFTMRVRSVHASKYLFIPDDCVDEMVINGQELPAEMLPICDYWFGQVVDLSPYIHNGDNRVSVRLHNDGGLSKLKIFPAHSDPLILSLRLTLFLLVALYLWRIGWIFCKKRQQIILWSSFCAAFLLRMYYLVITRFEVRGHDSQGHVEYIRYLVDNGFSLPISTTGWEFYHPPLYYYLAAVWMKVDLLFTSVERFLLRDIQVLSLLLSAGMLGLLLWIGVQVFPKKTQLKERILFFSILALQPSFVYFSSRINNDVLYQFFAFAFLGLLIAWWDSPKKKYWILASCMLALGLLSKSTAFILFPLLFAALLLKRKVPRKEKLRLGTIAVVLIAFATSWFYSIRFLEEKNTSLVQNLTHLSEGLAVDGSFEMLTEFNPIRVIREPYNSSWDDRTNRDHFWEYWLRSAFFGEYSYGQKSHWIASTILFLALILLPFAILGFTSALRKDWYGTFPLWSTAVIVILSHIAYRQYAPFSSSQDFRYSILLLVPFSYFLIKGIQERSRFLRAFCFIALLLLLLLHFVFLVGLPYFER